MKRVVTRLVVAGNRPIFVAATALLGVAASYVATATDLLLSLTLLLASGGLMYLADVGREIEAYALTVLPRGEIGDRDSVRDEMASKYAFYGMRTAFGICALATIVSITLLAWKPWPSQRSGDPQITFIAHRVHDVLEDVQISVRCRDACSVRSIASTEVSVNQTAASNYDDRSEMWLGADGRATVEHKIPSHILSRLRKIKRGRISGVVRLTVTAELTDSMRPPVTRRISIALIASGAS